MEISDVVKIRNLLRSATRTITVYDKDTNESLGEKEVPNPITVELDNSLGISEEVDNVFWNDEDGIIVAAKLNCGDVRGSNWAMGHGEIKNPAQIYVADYTEIQQFRMVLDKESLENLLKALKANGNFKYCKDSTEIPIDDNAINRVMKNITQDIQPINGIMKPSEYYNK